MTTLYDVPADELIDELAVRLEDRVEAPEWAALSKTGSGRELPPEQENFWAIRAASLLRKVATNGPVGVQRLETEYGSAKRGSLRYKVSPARRSDASGNIIRTILQQLEEEDLVESVRDEGRAATPEGQSLLDDVAGDVFADLDRPELERYA